MIRGAGALLMVLLMAPAVQAGRPWWLGLNADYLSDDNINRGPAGQTLDDSAFGIGAEAGGFLTLGERSGLRVRLHVDANRHDTYDKLDRSRILAEASLRFRPGHGYTATRYALELGYAMEDWRSSLRDAGVTRIRLQAGGQTLVCLQGRLALGYESRKAEEETFSLDNTLLEGYLNYRLYPSGQLYLDLSARLGEAVSSLDPSTYGGGYGSRIRYTAWVADDAFLPGWWAYRIDADTGIVDLGFNHAFSRRLSLDLLARGYRTRPREDGPEYSGTAFSLALLYRY